MEGQKLPLQSCDQCNKRRVRCNRDLPQCNNCDRREEQCTYLRKLKTEPYLTDKPYLAERITVFRNLKRRGPKVKQKNTLVKFNSSFDPTIQKVPYLFVESKQDDWQHIAYRLTLGTPDRNLLNFLMVAFDFPLLSNKLTSWSKAFIKVMNEVNPWAQKTIIPHQTSILPYIDNRHLNQILNNALNNYFEYFNPIIPLFTCSTFSYKLRSNILMLTIWVTGLSIDQHIPIIKQLRDYLLYKFTIELRKCYHKQSIDVLQAYIISIGWRLGYRGKPTNTSILCCIPIHILHSLGLHLLLPRNKLNKYDVTERRLLYSALIFLDSNWASGNNTPCMLNLDHANVNQDVSCKEIQFHLKCARTAEEATYDLIMIYNSRCNYIDSTILHTIRILRHQIHADNIESKELLEHVRRLQLKCRTLFLGFIKILHDLKKPLKDHFLDLGGCIEILERGILSLNMRFRIVYRDITALLLHLNPDLDDKPSKHTFEKEGSIFISEAVEAALQVFTIENQFNLLPYHASRPSHLGKTLIMLIKLKKFYRGPVDIEKQIELIRDRMSILKTVESWSSQVTFNLYLADKFANQKDSKISL